MGNSRRRNDAPRRPEQRCAIARPLRRLPLQTTSHVSYTLRNALTAHASSCHIDKR